MRQFVVSEAPVSRVAHHVREVVEQAGGIVAHHTSRKTEFDHLDYGDQAWRRAGYVGTYERYQEKPVQVRIRVWAQWPRRLLVGSVYLGFAVALLFFALSILEAAIPPNVWILTAIPIFVAIAASLLMYTSSMADSEGAEEEIEDRLLERLAEDEEVPGEVYDVEDWEAYRETVIEDAKDEARERMPHGGSRLRRAAAKAKGSVTGLASGDDEADEPAAEPETEPAQQAPEDETADEDGPGLIARTKTKLGLGDEDPASEGGGKGQAGPDAEPAQEGAEDEEPAEDEGDEGEPQPAIGDEPEDQGQPSGG